jgi:hypothetical protein
MRKIIYILIILSCNVAFITGSAAAGESKPIPRTIIALYDGHVSDLTRSNIHTLVEMPLNHLGLNIEYYDVHKTLPDITKRDDVRGVVTWLFFDTKMNDPVSYLKWAINVMDSGKKYVVLGTLGISGGVKTQPSLTLINSFMGRLGIKMTNGWTETAYDVKYDYKTPEMFLVTKPFEWLRPSYETALAIDSKAKVHLSAYKGSEFEENSDLVITAPNGGYISSGYIFKTDVVLGKNVRQWVIDPFMFFRLALETDDLPKPDTTTLAGRRIYYSHIDGDGFNSVTRLEEYKNKQVLSAEVIMEKAVKAYPDLPVTLTVIAADVDPKWAAVERSRDVAKEFFALPQVEAGSHTYSHPFNWAFFEDKDNLNKEIPYLRLYPKTPTQPVWKPEDYAQATPVNTTRLFSKKLLAEPMPSGYAVPRAYAQKPFDLNREIEGSIREISALLPKDKKVELISWPGDCSPWEDVVRLSRKAGVQNINGGDTLLDMQHPYYATVAPIGRPIGKERQIYASTSNEIPYTKEWTENFDAYRHLLQTLKNTESPIRLKPINIYYHLYSGEREAGLNALLSNIKYAVSQKITPITTSHFTHIAEGFYTTEIIPIDSDVWSVEKRGSLQTIRFDRQSFKSVDFQRSKGVIGQNYVNGSLYVYLDSSSEKPVIALKTHPGQFAAQEEKTPYLIESRWEISDLVRDKDKLKFKAQGFGSGDITWQVPDNGNYQVNINGQDTQTVVANDRILQLKINQAAIAPLQLTITRI